MTEPTPPAPAAPVADPTTEAFIAPIKTVHETAASFSNDAFNWVMHSTTNALLVLLVLVSTVILLQMLRRGLLYMLGGKSGTPSKRFARIAFRLLGKTSVIFVSLLGCWLVAKFIALPKGVLTGLNFAFVIMGFIQLGLWLREIALMLIERRLSRQGSLSPDTPLASAIGVLGWLVNVCVWSIILLLLLDNLGVNITALVAGLGIGGLAVGLAAQGIMGDLFSALSIVFDKPFVRGDFITFGDKQGTVENVGLKTSRLRALSGELIIVANGQLLSSVIHNHRQMNERRTVLKIGVTYATPADKIEQIQKLLQTAIEAEDNCRFDRAHLASFGDSALNFEAVYFYIGRDYNPYMDANQAILLRIMRGLEGLGVSFAFPTRTIHMVTEAA